VGIYPSYQIFTSSQTCRFWSFSRRQSEVYRALNASQSSGICVAVSRSWPSCPISVARSIWNASTCAGCHQLTSLGSLATLPALEYLSVATCYRLERLPDLRSSKRFGYLSLCHSGVRLSSDDIMILATLSVSSVFVWDHCQLRFSEMLEKMPLTEVVTKIEAKQLEFFAATPETIDWHFTHVCMHDMTVSAVGSISDRS
jgi:cytochrome c553